METSHWDPWLPVRERPPTDVTPGLAARVPDCRNIGSCRGEYDREFFRPHNFSRGAFQAALEQFGVRDLVQLTILMGYYGLLAFKLNAFDTDTDPAGITE